MKLTRVQLANKLLEEAQKQYEQDVKTGKIKPKTLSLARLQELAEENNWG